MKVTAPTIGTLLQSASLTFKAALGLPTHDATFEAQLLLAHVLKKSRAHLLSYADAEIKPAQFSLYDEMVTRRAGGEPVAYILGFREFYSKDFIVSPDVLIPRPETELLVDFALSKLTGSAEQRVLDLGTGCGAIALTIAAYRPHVDVTAVDKSLRALTIAEKNRIALKIENVRFKRSDWFSALHGEQFDLIVTNPPYVAATDAHLQAGDVRFEPISALSGGPDGLTSIRQISQELSPFLKPGGWVMTEHGYDQAAAVREIFLAENLENVGSCPDLAGILRVTFGQACKVVRLRTQTA